MPIKDPLKNREYQRSWIANKRKQQKLNVEPTENNFIEPQKVECFYCPKLVEVKVKNNWERYAPYFAPICPGCLPRHQEEEVGLGA